MACWNIRLSGSTNVLCAAECIRTGRRWAGALANNPGPAGNIQGAQASFLKVVAVVF